MNGSETIALTPAMRVLKVARETVDREMASISVVGDPDVRIILLFREAFVSFLEQQVRGGMEAGDAIYGASAVSALLHGLLVAASSQKDCTRCAGEAASEIAEILFSGAGVNASVQAVASPARSINPTTKH